MVEAEAKQKIADAFKEYGEAAVLYGDGNVATINERKHNHWATSTRFQW